MGEAKYGRLFTEDDVLRILRYGADRDWSEIMEEFDGPDRRGLTFPADEPLFLLRGQDKAVLDALIGGQDYEDACVDARASGEHLAAIQTAADEITAWQRANPDRVKVPD